MKTVFQFQWYYFLVIHFRIVIILHLIISDLTFIIYHILTDVYIGIIFFTPVAVGIIIAGIIKLILNIIAKFIFMAFFIHFKRRVFFQFFFDTLFKVGRRHL